MALLGGPATCPHGNPIPGTGAKIARDLRRLEEFAEGDDVVLERLTEDVELHTDVLRYFEEHGLMPGNRIRVLGVAPDGTMSLEVGGSRSTLGPDLADNLWVRPATKRRASARR
jgi:DtxR family Mn-dependent transcriptional regulator